MPRWIVPLLIASAIIFILEYYAFQAVKTVTKNRIVRWGWMAIGILVYLNLLYVIVTTPSNSGQTKEFQMATGMMITILIPKIFILVDENTHVHCLPYFLEKLNTNIVIEIIEIEYIIYIYGTPNRLYKCQFPK